MTRSDKFPKALPTIFISAAAGYIARVLHERNRAQRKPRRQVDGGVPIGIGNADSQQSFIHEHEAFLCEHPHIHSLLTKTFARPLAEPSKDEVSRLENLPESDPAVAAFEDKVMADDLVFFLRRMAADDFAEILILSGNGYGIGAWKILRGMYERIVTAANIAKNPREARVFVEDEAIKKWTLWRELSTIRPELKTQHTEEEIKGLEERYNEVRAKRKEEICPKCRQPKTQEAWTRVTMLDMAKSVDSELAAIYPSLLP
jgi:Family of unknown function (DUF5677)